MNRFTREQLEDERRKVLIALGIAIFIHLLLFFSLAAAVTFRPTVPPPPKEEKPVELTIMDQPPPRAKPEQDYISTTESQREEKPPENHVFQSDKNTHAASPLAASGTEPLPTQEGEKIPAAEFENREYTAGREPRPASPAGAPPQPAQSEPQPTPAPAATPADTPEEAPTPRATSQLALMEPPKARETPKTTPPPQQTKSSQQPTQQTTQAQPSTPSAPGFQPQTRVTQLRGNITRRGSASVDADGTPLGKYKKEASDAIGSGWYFRVNSQGDFSPGTVEATFNILADGRVANLEISNRASEALKTCVYDSIMKAEIPSIPKELLPMLPGGGIKMTMTFTIL